MGIFLSLGFVVGLVTIFLLLVGGFVVILLVRRWCRRDIVSNLSIEEQLNHYHELYETGDITEEEYQQIQQTIQGTTTSPSRPQSSS